MSRDSHGATERWYDLSAGPKTGRPEYSGIADFRGNVQHVLPFRRSMTVAAHAAAHVASSQC